MIMKEKLLNNKVLRNFVLKSQSKVLFSTILLLSLFSISSNLYSQTTLINPAAEGGFSLGNTFAANGWTVANEGTGIVKWEVGTIASSGSLVGNAAFISPDGGESYSSVGGGVNRTMYFYRDVVLPAGQTNIALTFDWKSGANTWQVFVAPTSVTPVGSDTQTSLSGFPLAATLAGATPVALSAPTTITSGKITGFIPTSFAGTTVRLIFMWTQNAGGSAVPLAIDNISLVSRVGGQELVSTKTGDFSDPTVWDLGYVPSPADNAVVLAGHTVAIDNKILGVDNLFISGASAILNFGVNTDEFTVANDLLVSGTGARFNVWNGTAGRSLKVGHNIDLASGGRLDVSIGTGTLGFGQLNLFGSTVQTISSDGTGILGGTTTSTTTTNTTGIIGQLNINNTSLATPNIVWNINNVRIKNALRLERARVALGTNKIILGNFTTLNTVVYSDGNGFIGGTVARWYGTGATGAAVNPGTDYNTIQPLFPILSATGKNRSAYLVSTTGATVQGELEVTYNDATNFTTGLSLVDGSYTVTDRYNGSWTINNAGSGGSIYTNASGTFTLGLYASGAYETNDGLSRIINAGTLVPGEHINGTTTPFIARKGITLANLKAGAIHVGFNAGSVLGTTTITSVASGDWNTPATWSTNAVPSCSDVVKIASGHVVTNNANGNAAGVSIDLGGTLVMASNTLTVGCTNNNAVFANYGTLTVTGGTLAINGAITHKNGSTFNQNNGIIIVDSNANGVQANSVGIGGTSFKIENATLNLQAGEIVIVDPLINNSVATTADSAIAGFTISTFGAAGTFDKATNVDATVGATSVTMNGFNSNINIYGVGQVVTGSGIAPGTTVTSVVAVNQTSNSPIIIGLSQPTTASIALGTTLTFSAMSNGCATINFPTSGNFSNVAIGQIVTGSGIPAGTTVVGFGSDFSGFAGLKLSNPVTGLATSPISAPETITFSAVSENCATIILSASNPLIVVGQAVGGTGIQPGTTVATITGVRLDLSLPTTSAVTNPVNLSFYDGNFGSYAFAYNSPNHYAAGHNHNLTIGDGVSIEKAAVTTNGFLCNFQQGAGLFSLGKLNIDAPDPINRFFNVSGILNVQNTFKINHPSTFKKTATSGILYFGGDVLNNGIGYMNTSQVKFMNVINGAEVATTTPQTVSGNGFFYNALTETAATGSFSSLVVNNTSVGGVTIALPNFRIAGSLTMNAGIIHTSTATPLYHGLANLSANPIISGNFSDTCFIDGPYWKDIPLTSSNASFQLFPLGKTSYKPISLAVTGGASITAEVFDTNTGTASANVANLSATRWTATRNGSLGALTDFNVRLGDAAITSNNILVQANSDQGTYDNVLGASTYAAGTPNTITSNVATIGTSYTGYFAYATSPICTTINPGNTIANLSGTIIHTQRTTATGIVSGNTAVTLSATANALIVPGLVVSGTGIQPGTTVVSVAGTTLNLSLPATSSSAAITTLTFTLVQPISPIYGTQEMTFTLQNAAIGNGITYQWQSSPDGSLFTDIPGANSSVLVAYPTATTYYRCVVTCSNGPISANSTPVQVVFASSTPVVTDGSGCANTAITLGATSPTGTATWYSLATGGTSLASGTSYAPSPAVTTTYYVSGEKTYAVGRSFTGTANQAANFSGISFNTNANIRLNSVKIHPKNTAPVQPITIKLYDKNGVQVPGTNTVTFTPTLNTGALLPTVFDVVTLNYDIPAGSGYKLLVTSGLATTTNTLGRIATFGDLACPVGAGSVSINGGLTSFVGSPDAGQQINFFDLSVTELFDAPRVPVTATVNTPLAPTGTATQDACATGTLADFVVTGAMGATYTWYDAATAGNVLPTSTVAVNNTTYYVSQTVSGCEGPRFAVLAQGTCLSNDDYAIAELNYYPNPVSSQMTITAKDAITKVEMFNLLGQQVKVMNTDSTEIAVDFSELPTATYLIKVYSEQKVQTFKVIKQ
jgi:hypothetical protein